MKLTPKLVALASLKLSLFVLGWIAWHREVTDPAGRAAYARIQPCLANAIAHEAERHAASGNDRNITSPHLDTEVDRCVDLIAGQPDP